MEERAKRKLSAILSADVKGYTRLMREDELTTVRTLEAHRELMTTIIQRYRGRVVDSPGDNLLAEFASVVDAVESAVEIQGELKAKNDELPENRRMPFRIGINLGDVIEEGERIYGDGVNIAARVEGLAEAGGICVSGTVFEHVKDKLGFGYEYLGEQEVKNIPEPVRVYRVRMEPEAAGKVIGEDGLRLRRWRWATISTVAVVVVVLGALAIWNFYFRLPPVEPASLDRMAYPLPDKPSIAVLPFVNMSGDPEQEYFSDGITNSIIIQLYKFPNIFVIHNASSFAYKGKAVKIRQVAEELGVRYVLQGGIQKAGNRIRINAQLIDATTGTHLWAESYDRELKDVFEVQDAITRQVVTELAVKLSWGETARYWAHMTENYEAHDLFFKAHKILLRFEKELNIRGRELLKKAIELDPKFARAIAFLGATHLWDVLFGWSENPAESFKQAEELANRALALDDKVFLTHALLSGIYQRKRLYEQAIASAKRAVEVEPNNANGLATLGRTLINAGKPEEAILMIRKAMRLSPHTPLHMFPIAGDANYLTGQYETAITEYKKYLKRQQHGTGARIVWQRLVASYMQLGKEEEARAEVRKLLEIHPDCSIEAYSKAVRRIPFKDYEFLDRQIELLRKAGLPETPPLPLPDKPSIAVLPFVNMSGDPEREYFSDGITEEIISALSKTPKMFVIARTSSFKYKGKEVDVRTVGRELGIRYVLEGSVRKSGEKVRITAQLIDAKTNQHLWAERYDRKLKDIFEIQDEITMKIINALQVELTEGEHARLWGKGTTNLKAYLKVLQAREHAFRWTKEDDVLCRQLLEQAIALDPEYAVPYAGLAYMHLHDVMFGSSKSPEESLSRAMELAQKSLSLDDNEPRTRALLSRIYSMTKQHDKAIAEGERAIALDPNFAIGYAVLGITLTNAGRPEEAIRILNRAIRLNPFPPSSSLNVLGDACRLAMRYNEAIRAYKKALDGSPNLLFSHIGLAATYRELGREEEARSEAAEVLRIDPKFSLEYFAKTLPYKNQVDTDRFIAALRKAGLK